MLEPRQIADWAELNRGRALRAMTIVDEALGKSLFIAGDRFSIADILGLVALDFVRPARIGLCGIRHKKCRRVVRGQCATAPRAC